MPAESDSSFFDFNWVQPLFIGILLGWYGLKSEANQGFRDSQLADFAKQCDALCHLGADYWQIEFTSQQDRDEKSGDALEAKIVALQHDLNVRLDDIAVSWNLAEFGIELMQLLDELADVTSGGKFQVSVRDKDISRISRILSINTTIQRLIFEQRAHLNSIFPYWRDLKDRFKKVRSS